MSQSPDNDILFKNYVKFKSTSKPFHHNGIPSNQRLSPEPYSHRKCISPAECHPDSISIPHQLCTIPILIPCLASFVTHSQKGVQAHSTWNGWASPPPCPKANTIVYLQLVPLLERFGLFAMEGKAQAMCGMRDLGGVDILCGSRVAVVVTCWQDACLEGSADTRQISLGFLTVAHYTKLRSNISVDLKWWAGAIAANGWQANFTGVGSHPRNLSAKCESPGIGTTTKRTMIRLITRSLTCRWRMCATCATRKIYGHTSCGVSIWALEG